MSLFSLSEALSLLTSTVLLWFTSMREVCIRIMTTYLHSSILFPTLFRSFAYLKHGLARLIATYTGFIPIRQSIVIVLQIDMVVARFLSHPTLNINVDLTYPLMYFTAKLFGSKPMPCLLQTIMAELLLAVFTVLHLLLYLISLVILA